MMKKESNQALSTLMPKDGVLSQTPLCFEELEAVIGGANLPIEQRKLDRDSNPNGAITDLRSPKLANPGWAGMQCVCH